MSPRTAAIVERDGPHCVWCGRRPWPRDLTLEHRLATSPRPAERDYGTRQLDLLRR